MPNQRSAEYADALNTVAGWAALFSPGVAREIRGLYGLLPDHPASPHVARAAKRGRHREANA